MDKIINYFNLNNIDNSFTTNQELIKVNSLLNNLNSELGIENKIKVPTLVTIGSQSSGKSTLLNRILKLNIIPTGSVMETRTPINIELINTNSDYYLEFGEYVNYSWNVIKKILITNNTEETHLNDIKNQIKFLTNKYAGEGMGISETEINIKLYSPHVSNLNFIDLPGLTMIACTDKGQPKDIKDQIRNLLIKYINPENNLILCIMPAREDLETDMALELVKQYDSSGQRTIGVLTKIDLMNKNSNICNYLLNNNISKDLQLDYGYYAIKNSNTRDFNMMTQMEIDFFNKHTDYSSIKHLKRNGIDNLNINLSRIFLSIIKKNIPNTLTKLNQLIETNTKQLQLLGEVIGDNKQLKEVMLTKYVTNIFNKFNDNIDNRCCGLNTGRHIKDTFIQFRTTVTSLNPFNTNICSNQMLDEIIKNSDGNHMSLPVPTIEIIEACILDSSINCIHFLEKPSIECCNTIYTIVNQLVDNLLKQEGICKFNELYEKIKYDIKTEVLDKAIQVTKKHISDSVKMEESYIWTDDPKFSNVLTNIPKNSLNTEFLRTILIEYFNCIKNIIQHNVPKIIMFYFIRKIQKSIQILLLNKLQGEEYINLLNEEPSVQLKRTQFKNIVSVLTESKVKLEKINNQQ